MIELYAVLWFPARDDRVVGQGAVQGLLGSGRLSRHGGHAVGIVQVGKGGWCEHLVQMARHLALSGRGEHLRHLLRGIVAAEGV